MKGLSVMTFALVANITRAFVPPATAAAGSSVALGSSLRRSGSIVRRGATSTSSGVPKATKADATEVMRKPQVVTEIMERAGLSKSQAEAALVAFSETVMDNVSDGKKINLQGFGTFESRTRAGRQGRNPRTGEPLEIKPTTVPAFSASKTFKDQVKGRASM